MTDSLHQMGFANPDSTPDKEGVVGKAGIFDDTLSGGVGKIIAVADHQVVKGIFRMKAGTDSGKGRRRILLIGKEGGGINGRAGVNGFDFKYQGVLGLGVTVEGGFEILIIIFLIFFSDSGVGAADGGSVVC